MHKNELPKCHIVPKRRNERNNGLAFADKYFTLSVVFGLDSSDFFITHREWSNYYGY